jgi:hypothetical protein
MKQLMVDITIMILAIGFVAILVILTISDREPMHPESAKLLAEIINEIPTLIGTYIGFRAGQQLGAAQKQ